MIKRFIKFLVIVLVSIIMTYCATVSSPQGGPRDTMPPKFIHSTTQNLSTNFNASNIILTFDEYIKLNNPSQNVSTSPPLGKNLGLTAVKNKLFITFKEPLEENITYHINFGNSIVDVNEGNEFKNFQFIFSTGDEIDSISVKGQIDFSGNVDQTKPTLVGLYRDLSDSAFYKMAPFYYTFLEENGTFAFRNLKNGTYQMIALTDNNGNKFYDLPTEAVGFLPNTINLDSNVSNISLPLFISEPDSNRVVSYSSSIDEYQIEFELVKSLGLNEKVLVDVFTEDQTFEVIQQLDDDRKKVKVFLNTDIDSISNFVSTLKINGSLIDSFQHSISKRIKPKLELSLSTTNFMLSDSIIIKANQPIVQAIKNILIIDSLKQDTLQLIPLLSIDNELIIKPNTELKNNYVYTLLILDSTLLSNLNIFNRRYTNNINFQSLEERGILNIEFENVDSTFQYIIEIENESGEIEHKRIINSKIHDWSISGIRTGTYKVQIIEDANLNGVWNSGSIRNKSYPEKKYYLEKEIVIRPNWELDETINFANP